MRISDWSSDVCSSYLRADPLRDQDGRIVQWFGLCHDIDDQMHAEDALRRASDKLAQATQAASLAELSASIAHEVNQPLAAIVANANADRKRVVQGKTV